MANRSVAVRVRNISARGALIDGPGLPAVGAAVDLRRGSLIAHGEIAWQTDDVCGVRFDADADVDSWTQRVGHTGQQNVDQMVALVQRPALTSAVSVVPRTSPVPATRQDSLAAISADLAEACDRLAARPDLVIACAAELQQLDAIAQRLRNAVQNGRAD